MRASAAMRTLGSARAPRPARPVRMSQTDKISIPTLRVTMSVMSPPEQGERGQNPTCQIVRPPSVSKYCRRPGRLFTVLQNAVACDGSGFTSNASPDR